MLNTESQPSPWLAKLNLEFRQTHGRTVMSDNTHSGPLRVQRTFDAEDGSKHVYILHPPGGYVAGDVIDIGITTQDGSHLVATSPGAAKFYRCGTEHPLPQQQTLTLHANHKSLLEWLPQETIFFKDANARLETNIHLSAGANFLGWEISCLGRTASGENFGDGRLIQNLNLVKDNVLLHRERLMLEPNDAVQTRAWGLNNQPVFGTLIAQLNSQHLQNKDDSSYAEQDQLNETIEQLRALFSSFSEAQNWSATNKAGIILVRYLGGNSESCKQGFVTIRAKLLKKFKQVEAALPRIWAT